MNNEKFDGDGRGYFYIAYNKSVYDPANPTDKPFKAGFTTQKPKARLKDMSTGAIEPWKLIAAWNFPNVRKAEKEIHRIYNKFRIKLNREFFREECQEDMIKLADSFGTRVAENSPPVMRNESYAVWVYNVRDDVLKKFPNANQAAEYIAQFVPNKASSIASKIGECHSGKRGSKERHSMYKNKFIITFDSKNSVKRGFSFGKNNKSI
jgi:hypothetical protein